MRHNRATNRDGLTLVELVVVLFIIVLLATVAVSSTESLVDQSRYETTKTAMSSWSEAVLGPTGEHLPDGSPWIRGFAADVGRLPRRVGADDDGTGLQELWLKPAGVAPFAISNPVGDVEVNLPAGWRGPYLKLSADTSAFLDSYGTSFQLLKADENPASAGDEVTILRSLGADGIAGGTSLNADLDAYFHKTTLPTAGPKHLADLVFIVTLATPLGAGERIILRVYGPVNGTLVTLRQYSSTDVGLSSIPMNGTNLIFDVASLIPQPNLVVGPRGVRAYRMTAGADPGTAVALVTAGHTLASGVTAVSPVTPVAVVEGGNPPIAIEIP